MSILDTRTGPWTGYASQTACRMRGKALSNCNDSGTASLLLFVLTLGVSESICDNRLSIRHRRRCASGIAAMREIFSFSLNSLIASASGRKMLNPSLILRYISPRMKSVIYGV